VAAVDDRFAAFIASDGVALLRFATLLAGDVAGGEDLLQSVLEKLYPRWASGHPPEDGYGYARAAILHAAQRSWRRRRSHPEVLVADPPEIATTDPDSDPLLREALLRSLGRLPKRQRAVVVLRYFDGRPESEVATLLGISVGTVKTHAHRGLRKLRDDPRLARHFQPVGERSWPPT
jgi:RNA polymerase sigma-70 factor (sigma-E family)